MRVEVDAFSGLPNPTWELSSDEANDILARLELLPPVNASVSVPDLGYRGFLLHTGDREIRIYQGFVITEQSGDVHAYRDSRGVEETLAGYARSRGFGNVIPTRRPPQ